MAEASTPADVKAITGSTLDDAVIQPFIDAAACIMERVAFCTTAKNITDECLTQACTWLAAHLLTSSAVGEDSATVKKERFENYSVERVLGGFSSTITCCSWESFSGRSRA